MKIEVLKENLRNGLGITERVVGKNISLPILQNVLLYTDGNFLSITSTDLEIAIKLWMLVKIINKGKVVVPAKFLSSVVASLPNEKITMEADGQALRIACKGFTTQLQGYNAEEFPLVPEFTNSQSIEVDGQKIYQGLVGVIDIASPSQSRPEISGVYFSFFKDSIKIVATDSFRLAEKIIKLQTPLKNAKEQEYTFILPQKSARELLHILENSTGTLKMYFSPNQILFELPFKEVEHPQIQVTSRLIEGEYPHYQDIIPTKFKTQVGVARDEFLNQIKTASLFSGKVNEVKISLNKEKQEIEISAKSPDLGQSSSVLPAKIEGDSLAVSFNYKYLMDGIVNIKSSELLFDVSKEEGPCILRPVGDASYLYVVMPIKAM